MPLRMHEEIVRHESARRYFGVNEEGTRNVIKGSMHERCWQEMAFTDQGTH